MTFGAEAAWGVGVAALGGLAVGIERQWSGHAAGPEARFAGLRTFTLLGLASGLAGWLWAEGASGLAVVVLAGLCGLVVAAYFAASRRDVDGTTEVAAFVVMIAAVLSGAGLVQAGSAINALTLLLLVEKKQMHRWVQALDVAEVRAGARFAVMATVILPLLPEGPLGPLGGVRPRLLWALVLFVSGLSFLGYIARRLVGAGRGYAVTGLLGGLVSSTSVTLAFSRLSGGLPGAGRPLAAGTMGANAMLFPRVLITSAVLAPGMALALWPALVAPFVVGLALVLRGSRDTGGDAAADRVRNPLQVMAALQMVLLFQAALFAADLAKQWFGDAGLYTSAAFFALADMDALTVSMAGLSAGQTIGPNVGALAIVIGLLSNTTAKLFLVLAVGRGRYRRLAAAGLGLQAAGLALAGRWLAG